MTLRHKISTAFAVLIALAAISIPLSLTTQRALLHQSERIADLYQYGTVYLATVASAAAQLRVGTTRLGQALEGASASDELLVALGADLVEQRDELRVRIAARDRFTGRTPDPFEQEYLNRFSQALGVLLRDIDQHGSGISEPDRVAAREALQIAQQQARLIEELSLRRLEEATAASSALMNDAARASDVGMRRLTGWLGGFVLIALGLAVAIIRSAVRPITELTEQVDRIGAHGTLSPTAGLAHRKDEIGLLSRHFDDMILRLRETLISQQFLTDILEAIPAAVVVRQSDGTLRFANGTARRLFGPDLEQLPAGLEHADEYTVTLEDGSERTLMLSRAHVDSGAADGHDVLVATDITPRRELERQQELTVAMLTHDLKTPLTALGGVLSLLEDTETSTSAERHRLYDAGTRNVQRMLALIGDMLELHQLRRGHAQIHLQPIRPRELVQEVVRGLAPAADEAGVTLTCGRLDEGAIVADPQRLQQVVENLCSNALRYAGKGATATVDVVATADALEIAVSDNGPGIPEAIRPILFKPFQVRSVGHKPHPNSTGLGLATAKLLVEQMGGTLRLAHTGPDGTRFSITFPKA